MSREQRRRLRGLYIELGHWRKAVALDADTGPVPLPRRPAGRVVGSLVGADPMMNDAEYALADDVEALVAQQEFAAAKARVEAHLLATAGQCPGLFGTRHCAV